MRKDAVCGLIAAVIAGLYLEEASRIPSSALGDTVGSAGFPWILGWILAAAAALLILQAIIGARSASAGEPSDVSDDEATARTGSFFWRAAGLASIAAAFITVLPFLGYILAVALMLAAVMLYQGLPASRGNAAVAAGGALVLYGLFGLLLKIPVPAGMLASLFG